MMKPCDICIEEKCGGTYDCDCSTCKSKDVCNKQLMPTVRLTTKCTQKCSHCCFKCSPDKKDFMTIETAKMIKEFINKHEVPYINLMGGEFYCNPDWKEIFSMLIPDLKYYCRLVTNGDWAEKYPEEFIEEFKKYDNLKVSISEDQWHTNKHVRKAIEELDYADIMWSMPAPDEVEDNSVVPIGRSLFAYNWYSSFGTYCSKPDRKYSFLIDEKGGIYKCPFGIFRFSNIDDEDFKMRFKKFNQRFYKTFITNCKSCINMHDHYIQNNIHYIKDE